MKKRLGIVIALICGLMLVCLCGCTMRHTVPLSVDPAEAQAAVIDEDVGYATVAWTVVGTDLVTVYFGDGEKAIVRSDGMPIIVDHDYNQIGAYRPIFKQDGELITGKVTITTDMPDVLAPFFLDRLVEEGEKIVLEIPRRVHGCNSSTGAALYTSGILPGAGTTEFKINAIDSFGNTVSLFDMSGDNVSGEWVELVSDLSELQTITCWALYGGDGPLNPMSADIMDCDDTCDPDDPWVQPDIPEGTEWIKFTMTVRSEYIPEPYYIVVYWYIYVLTGGCS